ncbi:paralemmin 1a isoform X2 [Pungitius pungitius]|uniref:paralemmin 1a isoform X2 n=1 Tax=Pungitius pungitius TaxID=134920 RepID=UPI002E10E014
MDEAQQDRQQLLVEKRKWQTELENKKRQLEDDRRALQHLKSKALRERWLLDGAPSAGPEQDEVRRQLEQDEAKTRSLEEAIDRLEKEVVGLESGGVDQTVTQTTVSSGSVKAAKVKGHSGRPHDRAAASDQIVQEVKVHKSPRTNKASEATEEMKRAMYSVEITVERDRVTGETRVLSTNTTLPVDLSHQGVKVYEDERKVVHEMNGEDGVQPLSSSEVEELLTKADKTTSVTPQGVATVTPQVSAQEEVRPESPPLPAGVTGLETSQGGEPSVAGASAENPVTMVFMGYQSVEDEDETKKVLGLKGTVKAELVLIHDANGKTSPGDGREEAGGPQTPDPAPPPASAPPPAASPATPAPSNREAEEGKGVVGGVGEGMGAVGEGKKEKQPCKCCSIM